MVAFGYWKAKWWSLKAECPHISDVSHSEGLSAYALKHSDMELARVALMEGKWTDVRARARLILADLTALKPNSRPDSEAIEVEIDIEEHEHEYL